MFVIVPIVLDLRPPTSGPLWYRTFPAVSTAHVATVSSHGYVKQIPGRRRGGRGRLGPRAGGPVSGVHLQLVSDRTCGEVVLPGHPSCCQSIQPQDMGWHINLDHCGGRSTGGSMLGVPKVMKVDTSAGVMCALPVLVLVEGWDCLS